MVNKRLRTLCLLFFIVVFVLFNMCLTATAASDTTRTNQQTSSSPFKDVTTSNPNRIFITYINQQGIIGGFPDGNYYPQAGLTRAQAAVVICKAAGLQTLPVNNSSFKDVAVDHWAAAYINAAAQAGYLKGFADGTYQPESNLTRAQGVSLIMRLCTQHELAPLPALNDLKTDHWAASSIGTALELKMIGLSKDGKNVYPDAAMSRGSLARALAILLTKDPGLNKVNLEGKLSEVKGQITLIRQGRSIKIGTDSRVVQGDQIVTGANSSVRLDYPDGSSSLVEADSEVIVKQSDGRRYIKQDGSSGIAVDYVNLDLKKGTIFDTVATKHETAASQAFQNKTQHQLAALDKFRYLAANEGQGAAWYKTAEAKKVKVKVDMPWGVAAIRGTFVKVTVNPDGTCQVACLTGSAEVSSNSGSSVALGGGQASGIADQGAPVAQAGPMSADDKAGFDQVQAWVVDTALQQDVNQAAEVTPVTILLSIPDVPANEQQLQEQAPKDATVNSAVQAVLDALTSTGIELRPEVVDRLSEQINQALEQVNPDIANELQGKIDSLPQDNQNNNDNNSSGGGEAPIVYASPPSSVTLAAGSTHPVGGVTNVAIPAVSATNTTGAVTGWAATTADTIKFTVTDTSPAVSTITINGTSYSSGTDYTITSASALTIIVTTSESGKTSALRTFSISVAALQTPASAPSSVLLAKGSTNPVGSVTNVALPAAGATDTAGAVAGWMSSTASTIKFTVTDTSPASSTITINGTAYTSGADYTIASTAPLNILVTTTETGKITTTRTFIISVTQALPASAPSSVQLAQGSSNPVASVTNVILPADGSTDSTGAVAGWVSSTAATIKFTVTDTGSAISTITINGAAYTSGTNYTITSAAPLTIVVTTSETGKLTAVRTFLVNVSAPPDISGSFTDPVFKQAVWQWLGNTGAPGSFTKQDLINRMAAQSYILGLTNNTSVTSLAGLENFEGTGLLRLNCYWDPLLTNLPSLPSSLTKIYCD
ncbi:MAG: S-layer homology domain-containing protein, partial [Deltaproteobacteria bacterium]